MTFPFHPTHADKEHSDGLVITVWDQDLGAKDDEVGRCTLPMESIRSCETKRRAFRGKVKLLHKGRLSGREKKGGSVDIEVYWENHSIFLATTDSLCKNLFETSAFTTEGPMVGLPLPLNYCVTNFNKLSGVAQTLIDKGKVSEYTPFRTFSLRIWYVALVFQGYTKGWNKNYKAAQQIYGRHSLSSKTIRVVLKIQNFMAYSNDYVNNHSQVHEISGMENLQKMLQSYDTASQTQHFSSPRYTYVIMPDSHMHFSATSKNTATDFLSKRALHAGAATEAMYSGEFFVDQCAVVGPRRQEKLHW